MSHKFFILTLGCRTNLADSEILRSSLTKNRLIETKFLADAELIFVNSCCVTHRAERGTKKAIYKILKEKKNNARVFLTGCYPKLKRNRENIPREVGVIQSVYDVPEYLGFSFSYNEISLAHTRFFLKIQEGCDYTCSFCIVPHTRGKSRSRPISEIKREFELSLEKGVKEIVLSGTQIGDWGKEWGMKLTHLLSELISIQGKFRIRLSSLHPLHIDHELIEILLVPKICNHLHLPLQSGSERILRLMKRPYTRNFYERKLQYIAKKIPDISIGTDIIVGFPGEKEEDFLESYNFISNNPFSYLHIFPYSKRQETESYFYKEEVPEKVKKLREKKFLELNLLLKKKFLRKNIGSFLEVVPEKRINGYIKGTSKEFLKVYFPSVKNPGGFCTVQAQREYKDGLLGTLCARKLWD